jgi:hypothetical protein
VIALLFALACTGTWSDAQLPDTLGLLLEREDGQVRSLLVGLERDARGELPIRVADGPRLFDGKRAWALPATGESPELIDLVAEQRRRPTAARALDLPPTAELAGSDGTRAWYRSREGMQVCTLADARCAPGTPPALRMEHAGPGHGFRVERDPRGQVRVLLPNDGVGAAGTVVAARTRAVLAVHWTRVSPDGPVRPILDRVFRGRGTLVAKPGSVVVDGELDEWAGAEPMVIDQSWDVDSGGAGWRGPRDASFSISGRWSAGRACLSGRVRDDAVGPGDYAWIEIDCERWAVFFDGQPNPGVEAAVVRERFGVRYETCRELPSLRAEGGALSLAVSFVDDDGDGLPTVLASAPYMGRNPAGLVRFIP